MSAAGVNEFANSKPPLLSFFFLLLGGCVRMASRRHPKACEAGEIINSLGRGREHGGERMLSLKLGRDNR